MPSAKPTPNGGAASTRQMLDELDALMERMLALPVNDLDDLAQEPPRPTLSATLTVIDTPQAEKEEPTTSAPALPASPPTWPEQRLYQEPDASEPPASEEFPAQPDLAEHEPPASAPQYLWSDAANAQSYADAPADTPEMPEMPDPVVQPLRRRRRSFVSWALAPFLRFNRAFDGWLERFGVLGHWLRRPKGRFVLGMAGLGMLTLAILWFVRDLASWTR